LNADRFSLPRITDKERAFLDREARREARRNAVRADFRTMVQSARIDDYELPADYEQVVTAAEAWVPATRDTRAAGAMIAAIRRHLDALAAILDSLENDRCRHRSHERVAEQTARVRALRSGRTR
jgi:hypothetical protein